MDLSTIRVKFQNVFEVYTLSKETFVYWSELNSISYILVHLGGWVGVAWVGGYVFRVKSCS